MKLMRDLPLFLHPIIFLLVIVIAYAIGTTNASHGAGFEKCAYTFVNGIAPKHKTSKNNNIINLCKSSTTAQDVGFAVAFNTDTHTADFAAYKLTREMVTAPSTFKRNNNWFTPDLEISTANSMAVQATNKTYRHSGLDRGHLVKAEDMKLSKDVYRSTFLYSVIVPQFPKLNRFIWRKVEEIPRAKIKSGIFDEVWIISGITGAHPTRQDMDVTVPACFYRVMIGKKGSVYSVAALIVPNDNDIGSAKLIESFSVSHGYLSSITKLDFLGGFSEMDWTQISINSGKWGLPPIDIKKQQITPCG